MVRCMEAHSHSVLPISAPRLGTTQGVRASTGAPSATGTTNVSRLGITSAQVLPYATAGAFATRRPCFSAYACTSARASDWLESLGALGP